MIEFTHSTNGTGEVLIQLLDSLSGRPIRAWTFTDQTEISIGRSSDQLVEISDPYVSRNHARLDCRDGEWFLVSLGRHGVVVANQLVTDFRVGNDLSFRLGSEGPSLRILLNFQPEEAPSTFHFESMPEQLFQLNEEKLQSEVGEITEGEYFRKLKARAQQLRSDRDRDRSAE